MNFISYTFVLQKCIKKRKELHTLDGRINNEQWDDDYSMGMRGKEG